MLRGGVANRVNVSRPLEQLPVACQTLDLSSRCPALLRPRFRGLPGRFRLVGFRLPVQNEGDGQHHESGQQRQTEEVLHVVGDVEELLYRTRSARPAR
jgi:hypothetical protein